MKIREYPKPSINDISKASKGGRIADSAFRPKFAEELGHIQANIIQERLDALLKDINEQAKKLTDGYNIKELVKYKSLVKKFLQEAVQKMYKLREEMGWDRRGRHKIYSIVESVDKELEALTRMFMEEQKDNMAILHKLDEIKGLLLDIYS
ncbi:hypothetical protein Tfer_2123 [Thermincola ferriacetica]|uniref:DUF327 domain-containing protein n=1 Tax=Thermincola ferriacetica TaxID=281456 RepID=A0A0L6W1B6_9FIRM|nr:YaaR family protein [Thermincola ferriacetica]KNZ69178.1 hypothetical protein Tfer_2123 [Thermincola ferriacetica]